jgi:hypothetical protein
MEYNSGSKPSLGKSTGIEGVYISSLKSNKYESANNKTIDVVFQPNGDSYNAIVDYEIGYDISNLDHSNDNSMKSAEEPRDIFNNTINQFFIGSITVIGLFMVYRMLQKHR